MIEFFIGVVVGMIAAAALAAGGLVLGVRHQKEIQDLVEGLDEGRLEAFPEKAEIIEPTSPEVEAMETVIKENEARGRDTKLEEL